MIKLTFLGRAVYGENLQEAQAKMFSMIANPEFVKVEYDEYVVQPGDSMYSIAMKLYGCGERWRDIAKLNRSTVRNANHILPGMILKLPSPVKY